MEQVTSPLLAGIPISNRFAEKLGIAQEKQDQQQMTHTKSSTQDDKSWDQNLYEKSEIYRSIKDAYTAPMRAWKGEIDPYSDQGVMEAINLAGVGLGGSLPGGARGPGSLGLVYSARKGGISRDIIDQATHLESLNTPAKKIYETTGLYRGPVDKEWRAFIPDKDAKINLDSFKQSRDYPEYYHLGYNPIKLEKVLDHPKLFKQFPWLKDVNVKEGMMMMKDSAAYDPASNTITVALADTNSLDSFTGVLLHEVQHAIQTKQDLTRGGNPGMFLQDINKLKERQVLFWESRRRIEDVLRQQFPDYNPFSRNHSKEIEASPLYEEVLRLKRAEAYLADIGNTAYQKYRHLGGEAEARAVDKQYINEKKRSFVGPKNKKPSWESVSEDDFINSDYPLDFYDTPQEKLTYPPKPSKLKTDGLNPIASPIQDLEASVKEQVKQLDSTGWDRLPGAAGKRDSDVQPTFLQKMYKEHPDLVKSKPSELEKLEIKLRRIYKLPEEEIEDIMLPLWSTYIRNQKPDDPVEEHTRKTKMKRWT